MGRPTPFSKAGQKEHWRLQTPCWSNNLAYRLICKEDGRDRQLSTPDAEVPLGKRYCDQLEPELLVRVQLQIIGNNYCMHGISMLLHAHVRSSVSVSAACTCLVLTLSTDVDRDHCIIFMLV